MIWRKPISFCVLAPVLVLGGTAAHAAASNDLTRFFDRVRSVSGSFEQVVTGDDNKLLERSDGSFWIARPGKFRWDYARPYNQEIVADGERVWVYDPELRQVTVRPLDTSIGNTPALLLAGQGRIQDHFIVRDLAARDGVAWMELKPRSAEADYQAIRIGFRNGQLHALELAGGFGQTTRVTFRDTRENAAIGKERFAFRVPNGVDVIRE